jgi:gamma-glutamyltranspeptidase/glutathione hydrolase
MAVRAGVAAHHPATAAAGMAVLRQGGSAVDAAVAASLAACVAETVMTGLGGGGHAITWDAAKATARSFDFFVAVPGLDGTPDRSDPRVIDIVFDTEAVPYHIGPGTVGVPGVPAGCEALWRAGGRLPWPAVVEPALRLARDGVTMPQAHAVVLAMLAAEMTLSDGGRVYAPGGRLLVAGDRLRQPGLVRALELLRDEGADSFYRGTVAKLVLDLLGDGGSPLTAADLDAYEVVERAPYEVTHAGHRLLGRRDLAGMLDTLARLPGLAGRSAGERAVTLARTLAGPDVHAHTTNVAAADPDGNACVVTTSLGLGSGDWVPGLDFQLNSMLGEVDLQRGVPVPGTRMGSMMAPTLALAGGEPVVAAGAAGGSRIRSALVQTLAGLLDEGRDPVAAVEQPRLHPVGRVVHTEPGFDPEGLAALEAEGFDVRRWRTRHHYFGGVSLVAAGGPAGDSRRDGAALTLDT